MLPRPVANFQRHSGRRQAARGHADSTQTLARTQTARRDTQGRRPAAHTRPERQTFADGGGQQAWLLHVTPTWHSLHRGSHVRHSEVREPAGGVAGHWPTEESPVEPQETAGAKRCSPWCGGQRRVCGPAFLASPAEEQLVLHRRQIICRRTSLWRLHLSSSWRLSLYTFPCPLLPPLPLPRTHGDKGIDLGTTWPPPDARLSSIPMPLHYRELRKGSAGGSVVPMVWTPELCASCLCSASSQYSSHPPASCLWSATKGH